MIRLAYSVCLSVVVLLPVVAADADTPLTAAAAAACDYDASVPFVAAGASSSVVDNDDDEYASVAMKDNDI